VGEEALLVHDAHDPNPSLAFALAHLSERPNGPTPIGVFRAVERPVYGGPMDQESGTASQDFGVEELDELLRSGDTWTVE
jgi:2-oxoglutarate ferredoxin oxidoreductase subunit beta